MSILRTSRLTIVYGILALVVTLQTAHAEAVYDSLSFGIPSESGRTKWFKTLKLGKPAILNVTVTDDPCWAIITRAVQTHPPETSVTPQQASGAGSFIITVPETMPERKCTFKFKGTCKYICGEGKGPGGPPEERPWNVTAMLAIDKCDYEDSGIEELAQPGTLEIIYKDGGTNFYDIDVTPEGHRMRDVNARLRSPIGRTVVRGPSFAGSRHPHTDPNCDCPQCDDPCWRVEIWWERLKVFIWYHIEMPRWLQADEAGPAAREAWQDFYDALLKHEQGHVKVLKDYYDGDGRMALETFVKKKHWGAAHDRDRAERLRDDLYSETFKAILDEYDRLQKAFHETPEGQPVPLPDPLLPCDE